MDEITRQRQELDRLLHRRGDLATMREDLTAQIEALDRESTSTVGAIQATRIRIANLEAEARRAPQGPKMVLPMEMAQELQQAQLAKK